MQDDDVIEIEREIITSRVVGNTIRFERRPIRERLYNVLRLAPKPKPRLFNLLRLTPKEPPRHNILKLPPREYASRHKLDLSYWRLENEKKRMERERQREQMRAALREKQRTVPRHLHIQAGDRAVVNESGEQRDHNGSTTDAQEQPPVSARVPATRLSRVAVILLIVSVNWVGLSALGSTVSYFSDSERSLGNLLAAALLDLTTSDGTGERRTLQCGGTQEYHIAVSTHINSLTTTYAAEAEMIGGDTAFCEALGLTALKDGKEVYQGPLLEFATDPQEGAAAWQFLVSLPDDATHIPHKAECDVDLVFRGWCTDVELFSESGFNDIERVPLRLAKKVPGCKKKGCVIGDVEIDIDNNNNADIDNDVDVDVNTGGNSADGGDGGSGGDGGGGGGDGGAGGSIDTGNATSSISVENDVNKNETTVNIGCTAGCTSCGGCTGSSTQNRESKVSSTTEEIASSTNELLDTIIADVEERIAQNASSGDTGTSASGQDDGGDEVPDEKKLTTDAEQQEGEIQDEPKEEVPAQGDDVGEGEDEPKASGDTDVPPEEVSDAASDSEEKREEKQEAETASEPEPQQEIAEKSSTEPQSGDSGE